MGAAIDKQLNEAEIFIGNALAVPEIREAFARARRDEAYFQEGKSLLDAARRLTRKQVDEYGDQYKATAALEAVREQARAVYMRHLRMARLLFRDDVDAYKDLRLNGRRSERLSIWIEQAARFYDNLLADQAFLDRMAAFGVEEDELRTGRAMVDEVVRAMEVQDREESEAQEATLRRDEALDALSEWMRLTRGLAPILLADNPQKLEALGILARS